jgi:hypothetical protein
LDRNLRRVWSVAFCAGDEDDEDEDEEVDVETICAFCFMTSAGVRMAQETSSDREEAEAWTKAMGRMASFLEFVLRRVKRDFVCS